MYKRILGLLIISMVLSHSVYSQDTQNEVDCTYDQVELGEDKHIAILRTDTKLIDSFTTFEIGRVIDFSLINYRGNIILNVEIYKDAREALSPICIGPGASFNLKLQNGENIMLSQVGAELCGNQLESAQEGFYNVKNRGSFLIKEDAFDKLKEVELISGNLKAGDNELYFIFKTEIYDDVNDRVNYPSFYFIDYLECVTHPQLIVEK
ncbi:hypothetical protein [Psychroflexus salis]|uniref:Uncharacterized protein n=1 Tax=Psychroflexus salis TaxID=1526574 RepID=A0A916ZZJ3_9FLAO|nr:hypothetical protein [Psychroflexus salis]GGE18166.1 hypothetical protein GCM10010831_19220 [Psychroflexus salis]